MAINPNVQKEVQQEIDEKLGRGRIASVDECLKLEYLHAAWKESLRMAPIVPIGQYFHEDIDLYIRLTRLHINSRLVIGIPHAALEEDSWKGYFIPEKTIVNLNIGFMLQDARIWGFDVRKFKPERFMHGRAKDLPDPSSISFGFGKRCVSLIS
jgi:cytochrome P450